MHYVVIYDIKLFEFLGCPNNLWMTAAPTSPKVTKPRYSICESYKKNHLSSYNPTTYLHSYVAGFRQKYRFCLKDKKLIYVTSVNHNSCETTTKIISHFGPIVFPKYREVCNASCQFHCACLPRRPRPSWFLWCLEPHMPFCCATPERVLVVVINKHVVKNAIGMPIWFTYLLRYLLHYAYGKVA